MSETEKQDRLEILRQAKTRLQEQRFDCARGRRTRLSPMSSAYGNAATANPNGFGTF
jgi:hypothetical protein